MNYLLDTAPFLWAVSEPGKLSPRVRALIADRKHRMYVSVASLWEVVIKTQKGLLAVPDPSRWLQAAIVSLDVEVLPIHAAHAYSVYQLPTIHKDPFDRLLITQALTEQLVLISNDRTVRRYAVQTVW